MEAQASASRPPEEGVGYPGSTVTAAALATLFFPVLSLIAALFLLGGQRDPRKRSAIRTWALASVAWLALQAVIAVLLLFAFWSGGGVGLGNVERSGPCVGGPEIGAAGKNVSGNGTKFVVPCSISGSTTVELPNG